MTALAVSVGTAADMLDLSESTIRKAIDQGALPAFRVGRAVRIFVSELEAWAKALTVVGSENDR